MCHRCIKIGKLLHSKEMSQVKRLAISCYIKWISKQRCDEQDDITNQTSTWIPQRRWMFHLHTVRGTPGSLFLSALGPVSWKNPKLFGAVSAATIPSISSQRRGSESSNLAILSIGFSYMKNVLKDLLFKTSRLQFDNCLLWPENFSEQAPDQDVVVDVSKRPMCFIF